MKLESNGITPLKGAPDAEAAREAQRAKLRKAAHELEGVFVRQLFEAMRKATPQEGGADGASSAQSTFTSLLDDALAGEAAQRLQRGLGEALYRQMARRLPGGDPTAPVAPAAHGPHRRESTPLAKPAATALPLTRDREGDAR